LICEITECTIEDARTSMRCSIDNTGTFEIRVGVHQGSCLSSLLFIIVMDIRTCNKGSAYIIKLYKSQRTHYNVVSIVLYCNVFKYLYSAPQQPWANRGVFFGSISSKKRDKF